MSNRYDDPLKRLYTSIVTDSPTSEVIPPSVITETPNSHTISITVSDGTIVRNKNSVLAVVAYVIGIIVFLIAVFMVISGVEEQSSFEESALNSQIRRESSFEVSQIEPQIQRNYN